MFRFHENDPTELYIDSSIPLESTLEFIKNNDIDKIIINQHNGYGFGFKDIKPFQDLNIKKLNLVFDNCVGGLDIRALESMSSLEFLYLSNALPFQLDFSKLSNLKNLNIEWSKNVSNLNRLQNLNTLTLRKFKGDINELCVLKNLKKLDICEGAFTNLDFLKNFSDLEFIEIAFMRKLENIDGLKFISSGLKELIIDGCKKINYNDTFEQLIQLERLRILNSSPIEDLHFVTKLNKLEELNFYQTDVATGDITPAQQIKTVSFENKRHFNCICENFEVIKKEKNRTKQI